MPKNEPKPINEAGKSVTRDFPVFLVFSRAAESGPRRISFRHPHSSCSFPPSRHRQMQESGSGRTFLEAPRSPGTEEREGAPADISSRQFEWRRRGRRKRPQTIGKVFFCAKCTAISASRAGSTAKTTSSTGKCDFAFRFPPPLSGRTFAFFCEEIKIGRFLTPGKGCKTIPGIMI